MRRLLRSLLRLLTLLVILALVLYLAARVYLTSEATRQRVVAHLQDITGGPVELQEADIGVLGGSLLHGLRFFQSDRADDEPWITVGTVETDISAVDLLRGAMPKKIILRDPAVTLRLDRAGRLLTQLPEAVGMVAGQGGGTLPDIRIEGGQVTIRQDGRPALVVPGLRLAVHQDNRIAINGTISDHDWGEWTLDGSLDPADGSFTVVLKTERTAVTQERLLQLPYVPPAVWHEVEASGATAVEFTFRHDPNARVSEHYRVVLHPAAAAITLPRLDLPLEGVRGGIIIDDGLVTLDRVSGQGLGGTLESTESTLDFRGQENRFHFVVAARDLDAVKVPRDWDVPDWLRQRGGRLSGQADFQVGSDGTIATGSTGEATVTGVKLGGKTTTVKLHLRPTGQGFGLGELPDEPIKPAKESRQRKETEPYVDITLDFADADLAQVVKDMGISLPFALAGRLTVQADISIPVNRPRDLRAYRVSGSVGLPTMAVAGVAIQDVAAQVRYRDSAGKITVKGLRAAGLSLTGAEATFQVGEERLTIAEITGALEGAAIEGAGEIALAAPYRYEGHLSLTRGDLGSLQRLSPDLRPPVAVGGQFGLTCAVSGTLGPFAADVAGTASAREVTIDQVPVPTLAFRWAAGTNGLRLTKIQAALAGGEVTGGAEVPLNAAGDYTAALRFEAVDVGALAGRFPAVPLRLEGMASGSVTGAWRAAAPGGSRTLEADLELASPKLRVRGLPVDKLTGRLAYRQGRGQYHLQGALLGGTFELGGPLPPLGVAAVLPGPAPDGHVALRAVQLSRLGDVLGEREALAPLHGRADLDLDYRLPSFDSQPVGSGRFNITGLHWGERDRADTLRGSLQLTEDELRLRDLGGDLGGGTVRGQAVVKLPDLARSHFNLAVDGADAGRMLAPWPGLAAQVAGTLDARLHGTLGRHWQGGGSLVLTRGKIAGVEVNEARLPLRFEFLPRRGRAELDCDDLSAQVAHGRVTGRVTLGLNGETRLDGKLHFQEVDLRALSATLSESRALGAGQVGGQIEFGGSNVHSLDDLTATVEAKFTRAQAFQWPILSQLVPFVIPGRAGSTVQSGELHGQLAGGVFRVQRLSLSGSPVDLFADGTISTAGRLNLDVTATTGVIGAGNSLLRLVGLRLPTEGPLPVTLLVETTRLVATTSIHLRVNGTVHEPAVRVEPLSVLSDQAARFFILRAKAVPF